jgi:hypothetical protein
MLKLLAGALSLFVSSLTAAHAQGFQCPPGSQQVSGGGGTMCQCPDGSYAGLNGCAQQQRAQPQIPPGSFRCGSGYCAAGSKCSRNGRTCLALDAVDCGNHACPAGNTCTPNGGCMPLGATACGSGYCSAGLVCRNNQCMASQQAQSGSLLAKLLTDAGNAISSRVIALSGNQQLSQALQQQNANTPPLPTSLAAFISDPYAGKPVTASQLPPPTTTVPGDPFHLNSDLSNQQKLTPGTTNSQNAQPSLQTAPGTYAACVGANSFSSPTRSYCEMGDYLYYKNGTVWNKRTGSMQ